MNNVEEFELFRTAAKAPTVKKITHTMYAIQNKISNSVLAYARALEAKGWRFYVVDQSCGRCYYQQRIITIPLWAYKRDQNYIDYYLCHEMAHAYAGYKAKHGLEFMNHFIVICPEESRHHELDYKPRFATAAGISKPIEALDTTSKKSLKEILASKINK